MTAFSLLAPAKINLSLKVLGRRDDGYHDLQSLMVALSVGDRLTFKRQPGASLQISCDHPGVPTDEDSLLARAFRFAAGRLDYTGGLEIHLEKRIPIGAGLGGGSSDAAAVMQAVERLTGRTLPADAYPEIAHQLGADIPFFLGMGGSLPHRASARRGPIPPNPSRSDGVNPSSLATIPKRQDPPPASGQWVTGVGELLTPCDLPGDISILLINPGTFISTKWVYEELAKLRAQRAREGEAPTALPVEGATPAPMTTLPPRLTRSRPPATVPPSLETLEALLPYVTNDLESVVQTQHPVIATLKTRLLELGADAALMSGSGSTVFGLYSQKNECNRAIEVLRSEFPEYWVQAAGIF